MTDGCGHCTVVESRRKWWLFVCIFVTILSTPVAIGWVVRPLGEDPAVYYLSGTLFCLIGVLLSQWVGMKMVELMG